MFNIRLFILLTCFSLALRGWAQSRSIDLDRGWSFIRDTDLVAHKAWAVVNLPHTWNAQDASSDGPGYYRGLGWYVKRIKPDASWKGKQLALQFDGANAVTTVYVNGRKMGGHSGGYTGFEVPISLNFGAENEIKIAVDNRYHADLPPLDADFTFYGGIYRKLRLLVRNSYSLGNIIVDDRMTSGDQAALKIQGSVSGAMTEVSLLSPAGELVRRDTIRNRTAKGTFEYEANVYKPVLWSPEHPSLYTIRLRLIDNKGKSYDEQVYKHGFRWFRFDADQGFFLNGQPLKLRGASRHQDLQGFGTAVPDSLQIRDIVLLKQMGANFIRIAHYPQDPLVLQACDSLGILASVEIPVVNQITESEAFSANCRNMLKEMINQNRNHSAVILWGYMNEILLKPQFKSDPQRYQQYLKNVRDLANSLNEVCHQLDPSRPTFVACHGSMDAYMNAGLLELADVTGWNLYVGWYSGDYSDFGKFLDDYHQRYPSKPILVTEFGADADARIRSYRPVRFDRSVDYALRYHQSYQEQIDARPFIAGSAIWNLADFNSYTRTETSPHMNLKGTLNYDRSYKDVYRFYQADWLEGDQLSILEEPLKELAELSVWPDAELQLLCNMDSLRVFQNHEILFEGKIAHVLNRYPLQSVTGLNSIEVYGFKDGRELRKTYQYRFTPGTVTADRKQLHYLLGASRTYMDQHGKLWQPIPAEYVSLEVGGGPYKLSNTDRLPYGSDRNIKGTAEEAVYQTQLQGISRLRLPMEPGAYRVTFHFAELNGGAASKPIVYDLGGGDTADTGPQRIFSVSLDGQPLIDHLDLTGQYGAITAIPLSFTVTVDASGMMKLDFKKEVGMPILNALEIEKLK